MPTAPDWTDTMAGLTGLRLAVYDVLLARRTLSVNGIAAELRPGERVLDQIEAAVHWLAQHRFIRTDDGLWTARHIVTARQVFEAEGPATLTTAAGSLAGQKGAGDRRSQGEDARAEAGGGGHCSTFCHPAETCAITADGACDARTPPPRPTQHHAMLLDLGGDY